MKWNKTIKLFKNKKVYRKQNKWLDIQHMCMCVYVGFANVNNQLCVFSHFILCFSFPGFYYLAMGLNSETTFLEIISMDESFDVSATSRLSLRVNSDVKHAFNSVVTWLMVGLLLEVFEAQFIAISIVFQTELISKFSSSLGSQTLLISPVLSIELTHSIMWLFSRVFINTGRAVINSNRTTPKP